MMRHKCKGVLQVEVVKLMQSDNCTCKRRRKPTGAALGDLSSLGEALGAAEGEVLRREQRTRKGLGAGGAKARRLITGKETVRLQQVLP